MSAKIYEGKECRQCGNSFRYVKSNRCRTCAHRQYKKWAEKSREKIKKKDADWYLANKDKARASNKAWQQNNSDKLAKKARERYNENKDKVLAINLSWRDKNRDKIKEYNRKNHRKRQLSQYGLTPEDYSTILESQGGGCAICGCPPPADRCLAVDHCHKTGKVRGILCGSCNRGLGLFKDDVVKMKKAVEYLEHFSNSMENN